MRFSGGTTNVMASAHDKTGLLLVGASNAGGVGRKEIAILSLYLASSHAVNRSSGKCNTATDHGELITLVTGKRRSLLM